MSKKTSSNIIHTVSDRKVFWNSVVTDLDEKLGDARKRVADLEFARRIFERNAASEAPIPNGGLKALAEEPRAVAQ